MFLFMFTKEMELGQTQVLSNKVLTFHNIQKQESTVGYYQRAGIGEKVND